MNGGGRKAGSAGAAGNAPRYPGRDLVRFFSRLTLTLEKTAGSKWLASSSARFRSAPAEDDGGETAVDPSLNRLFRRLGYVQAGDDFDRFLPAFIVHLGEAVSRPPAYCRDLLRVFARGDEEAGVKPLCGATPRCRDCGLTKDCDYYNRPRKPAMAALAPARRLFSDADGALSDRELVGVLLFGEKGAGDEPLVGVLFGRYGGLRAIFGAGSHEYSALRGISHAQALRLTAVTALYRRLLAEKRGEVMRVSAAKDLYDRYAAELTGREAAAVAALLGPGNHILSDVWFRDVASVANLGVAEVVRPAVRAAADGIALVQSRPSGDSTPSGADRDFTRRLRSACDLLELRFIDHVIVAENGYFSFAESGMLEI